MNARCDPPPYPSHPVVGQGGGNDLLPKHILQNVTGFMIKMDAFVGETDLLVGNETGKFKE